MATRTGLFAFLVFTNFSIFVLGATDDRALCLQSYGHYTPNSIYSTNLNNLLSSLPSKMGDSGFYNASQGQDADQIYVIALCRADLQLDSCRKCVQNVSEHIVQNCSTSKQAIFWAEKCMIRYSNVSFLGHLDTSAVTDPIPLWSMNNVASPDQFNVNLMTLMGDLRTQAASGGSMMKVSAGSPTVPNSMNIYALLQCTPDISEDDCINCLMGCTQALGGCCSNITRRGVRMLLPNCNLRYESDPLPFYDMARIQEAQRIVSPPPPPLPPPPPGNKNNWTVIIVVVTVVISLILVVFLGIWVTQRRKKKQEETRDNDGMYSRESLQYDFNKIREATNNFSEDNKLGEGGFGVVYKGKLGDGQEIAAKRLVTGSVQGHVEFQNEVILLAKLHHRNLVRLIGFAQEGIEKVLIYEFIPNSSLDHFIFDPIKSTVIDWTSRFQIIRGVAKGLLYLHEDSRLRIIHRDLKPSNILLDANMNPKITDFGTARLCDQDESEISTRKIAGTWGYMAPEYVNHGHFSIKSDVFSFGVLVLEIICGQRNRNATAEESLVNFVWRNWQEGTTTDVMDPILKSSPSCFNDIIRCVHIALLCIQQNAIDRPTMASVVLMLSSVTVTLPLHSTPAFLDVARSCQDNFSTKNDVSISDLLPR